MAKQKKKKKEEEFPVKVIGEDLAVLNLIEMALAKAIKYLDQLMGQPHNLKKCEEGLTHLFTAHEGLEWIITRWDA
ncbi:MAG: hypothetical protein ACE5IC_00055 [Candidatus Brocadiales bacterium]